MTGDFEVDQKSQLCGIGLDPNRVKDPAEELSSKAPFNFPNAFQSNGSKSNCRGDINSDQSTDADGNFCRQGLGDQANSQNKISASPFGNDQSLASATSDPIDNTIDSLKALSLKPDSSSPTFQPPNLKASRDAPFSGISGDTNPFAFERSHSTQKFDGYNFLGDAANVNPNGKSRSSPESSSGIDSAYSSVNPRNHLLTDNDNPASTSDGHIGGPGGSYWGTGNAGQSDDVTQSALSLSNLSPLLTNLLFQQAPSGTVSTNSSQQPNQVNPASVVAKRAITGGHQSMRQPLSRPPGWNSGSAFDSNFMTTASDQSVFCPPTTSGGIPSSKPPGWMGNFSSQSSNSYPWAPTGTQQSSFKPSFGDMNSTGFSSGSGMRFGMNSNLSGMGSNGFPKGSNSNPASMYSMFPKRPPHRMMAHWQQQQQHHQQHMQQAPGSMLNKQHSSDFGVSSGSSPFGGNDSVQSSGLGQKISHSSFGPLGSSANAMPNNLMGNNLDGLGPEKLAGLDNFRGNYNMDPHLFELMKSMDSSGNAPPALLDELGMGNMSGMDNFHGNLHSMPSMPQSRGGMMQNQGMHGMNNAYSSLSGVPPREEGYSRKVFVGGLPPDIDEGNFPQKCQC